MWSLKSVPVDGKALVEKPLRERDKTFRKSSKSIGVQDDDVSC